MPWFGRFTDQSRKALALANREAVRFGHEYIGPEHILLGVIAEGSGIGANVLKEMSVDLRRAQLEVEKLTKTNSGGMMDDLPRTSRAKKVIEHAIREARSLNHGYVGTEHLLLSLVQDRESVAAQMLVDLSVGLEGVREKVFSTLVALEAVGEQSKKEVSKRASSARSL